MFLYSIESTKAVLLSEMSRPSQKLLAIYILVAWQGHRGDKKQKNTQQNSSQSTKTKRGLPGHYYI